MDSFAGHRRFVTAAESGPDVPGMDRPSGCDVVRAAHNCPAVREDGEYVAVYVEPQKESVSLHSPDALQAGRQRFERYGRSFRSADLHGVATA